MLVIGISLLSVNSYAETLSGFVSKINYQTRSFSLAKKTFQLPEYVHITLAGIENSKFDFSQLSNGMQVQVNFSKGAGKPIQLRSMQLLIH